MGVLDKEVDQPVTFTHGMRPNLCAIQKEGMRNMEPQLRFAKTYQDIIPDQCRRITIAITVGSGAVYIGGIPVCIRARGAQYQIGDGDRCALILGGFWGEVFHGWADYPLGVSPLGFFIFFRELR